MTNVIMTQTLPAVVGMGVTSRAVDTTFGRKRSTGARRPGRGKVRRSVVLGVASTKAKAMKLATQQRNLLKRHGVSPANKVKTVKVRGGYVVTYVGR